MLLNTLMSKARLQINTWRKISQQRSEIKKLSDHLLDDIGLTRFHADREINRPLWDIARKNEASFKHSRNTDITSRDRTRILGKCVKYS